MGNSLVFLYGIKPGIHLITMSAVTSSIYIYINSIFRYTTTKVFAGLADGTIACFRFKVGKYFSPHFLT